MRAGPLSNDKIIELLNTSFVPVFVSNEDYEDDGRAPADERQERNRIWQEAAKAGLSSGTVHAYVLSPDGAVIDSLHVAEAAKVEKTRDMLERAVARFGIEPGKPLVEAKPQSAAPEAPKDGFVMHVVVRYLKREGLELLPLTAEAGLGETRNGSWQAYPAENWIVLTREEAAKLLPPADANERKTRVGDGWTLDRATAEKLLVHFYPSTECNDVGKNRIEALDVSATVESVKDGVARATIRGRLKMKHPFYPGRDDDKLVETELSGYIDFDAPSGRIRTLRIVTDDARYGEFTFGAALRSVAK